MPSHPLFALPRPFIIAHRGASGYAPENTLEAFRLAVAQHADAVELDAKLTRDGRIVVMHDNTIDRTTNGHGAVREMDWATLQGMSAGGDPNDPQTAIPLLEAVLQTVGRNLLVNIELTNYAAPWDALPYKVGALVQRLQMAERIWVSSFNPIALSRFGRRFPHVPVGFLIEARYPWIYRLFHRFVRHELVEPPVSWITPEAIRRWHARGKLVVPYTVNEAEVMRRFFAWGVDGIFTDDPPLARQVRDEVLSKPQPTAE